MEITLEAILARRRRSELIGYLGRAQNPEGSLDEIAALITVYVKVMSDARVLVIQGDQQHRISGYGNIIKVEGEVFCN